MMTRKQLLALLLRYSQLTDFYLDLVNQNCCLIQLILQLRMALLSDYSDLREGLSLDSTQREKLGVIQDKFHDMFVHVDKQSQTIQNHQHTLQAHLNAINTHQIELEEEYILENKKELSEKEYHKLNSELILEYQASLQLTRDFKEYHRACIDRLKVHAPDSRHLFNLSKELQQKEMEFCAHLSHSLKHAKKLHLTPKPEPILESDNESAWEKFSPQLLLKLWRKNKSEGDK